MPQSVWCLGKLLNHLRWSSARLQKEQDRELRAIVRWAYDRVPYYRDLFTRIGLSPQEIRGVHDLQRLPILEKEEIQNHPDAFLAEGINPTRCRQRITSGSTAEPFRITLSRQEIAVRAALSRRIFLFYALYPYWRTLQIGNSEPFRPTWHQRLGIYREKRLNIFLPIKTLAEQYRQSAQPILMGYPSVLEQIALALRQMGGSFPKPKAILTISETLRPNARILLQDVFQAPLHDLYACQELGYLAWECSAGNYHLASDCFIFETAIGNRSADPGQEGELIVTSLYNKAMPFIRYRLGDRVRLSARPCRCGCALPALSAIAGRSDDMLLLRNGQWVYSAIAVEGVVKHPKIKKFKIVQNPDYEYSITCKCDAPLSVTTRAEIETYFKNRLGAKKVLITEAAEIPQDPSGKFRNVIFEG